MAFPPGRGLAASTASFTCALTAGTVAGLAALLGCGWGVAPRGGAGGLGGQGHAAGAFGPAGLVGLARQLGGVVGGGALLRLGGAGVEVTLRVQRQAVHLRLGRVEENEHVLGFSINAVHEPVRI